jgi:hypothetical protein
VGWEKLHRLVDLISVFTAPTAIAGAIILYVNWLRDKPRIRRILGWSLISAALVFYAFDLADRFGVLPREQPEELIDTVGMSVPNTYLMLVNTKSLLIYRDTHRLVLCAHLVFSELDRMTDANLEKTIPYTITGDKQVLGGVASASLLSKLRPGRPYLLEYDLLLTPKEVSSNQITSLENAQQLGVKIIGTRYLQNTPGPPQQQDPH